VVAPLESRDNASNGAGESSGPRRLRGTLENQKSNSKEQNYKLKIKYHISDFKSQISYLRVKVEDSKLAMILFRRRIIRLSGVDFAVERAEVYFCVVCLYAGAPFLSGGVPTNSFVSGGCRSGEFFSVTYALGVGGEA